MEEKESADQGHNDWQPGHILSQIYSRHSGTTDPVGFRAPNGSSSVDGESRRIGWRKSWPGLLVRRGKWYVTRDHEAVRGPQAAGKRVTFPRTTFHKQTNEQKFRNFNVFSFAFPQRRQSLEHKVSICFFILIDKMSISRQHEHVVIPFIGAAKTCICHSYTDRSFFSSSLFLRSCMLTSYESAPRPVYQMTSPEIVRPTGECILTHDRTALGRSNIIFKLEYLRTPPVQCSYAFIYLNSR